jgi:hypothetical protein
LLLVALCFSFGCATVNPQSAVRLSGDAQLTMRAIADSLEGTRQSLETFVEGQVLHSHLTGRSALAPSELCSIRAVQRSLRQRIILLRKLGLAYDSFIALSHERSLELYGIYDELMTDVDRYELLPDATPGPTCPDPDLEPAFSKKPAPTAAPLSMSRSTSLRQASTLIRQALSRLLALWEAERPVYLSLQRNIFLSQKTLTRALFVKLGTVSPASAFAPQLAGLGLSWDDSAYREQLARWPADKQRQVQEAVLAVLERRAEHRISEEEARYAQHGELLRILYRQHEILEAGQALDLRQLAWFLAPAGKQAETPSCAVRE